jgi:Coenzyme PQQ synthesis protein D (PqqD)
MDIKKEVAVSDSGFVFLPTTGESFSVNPLGMEIINLMKGGKSFNEITAHIAEHYNVDESTAEKDLHDFIEMLNLFSLMEDNGDA